MIVFQENTHFSQALPCTKEEFWKQVRKSSTAWKIDSRREILEAVERHDSKVIGKWLKNEDYQKFLLKKQKAKKKAAKEAWAKKSDAEKLLAFAQELKDNQVAFIFSCREFDATPTAKGGMFRHRRLADCHLNGLVMLDIDHVENPQHIFEDLKTHEELMDRTALVHITSSKKGIRIVFTADIKDGNLADNVIVFSEKLGYQADSSCIDATRNSFAPKEEDILYINEEKLFDYYDEDFDKRFTPEYREKRTQPLFHKFGAGAERTNTNSTNQTNSGAQKGDSSDSSDSCSKIKWRGYDLQSIIDARYGDKLPCRDDSNRHKESLKLATDLLLMLDGDKQLVLRIVESQKWVQEIIEERDENVAQTVDSAASCVGEKEKKYASSLPSKAMLEAIQTVTGRSYQEITKAQTQRSVVVAEEDITRWLWDWGEKIETLMEHFPALRDICKGLKRNQYPAALIVGGGLMMTLMTRCTYRFYHRPEELRRLNCSALIIGDPASGKSFATRLYKLLMGPVFEADKVGKDAVNAYREQMRTKGANKEKPKKPKVVIRVHPARTSNAQFTQDMVNAVEIINGEEFHLHMFTFDTELDNTVTIQKGGSWIDKQSLELKAFHNEEDGVAYSNNDSVLQDFNVYWNFIYTGTPIALKKKVNEQNFGSGLATRLTCIPLPATNFQMISRERVVDLESDERLKEWAAKLDKTKGELSVQKLVDELYDWTARRMADAQENESKADEMLLKRCAYHGLNFAAPFIVMRHWDALQKDGDYWTGEFETDEVDWQLAELIVNMQYACQRHYFGAMAEAYFDNKDREIATNVRHQQKTIEAFNRLPEEFTVEDVERVFDVSNTAASSKIHRMIKDHLVEKSGDFKVNGTIRCKYVKTGISII